MGRTYNLLFVTFVLNRRERDLDVRCCGCKNITVLEYKKPPHIRGILEFEGQTIPVVDPSIWFCSRRTPLTRSTCILIVEHTYEGCQLRTAVLVQNMEEVLNLAASSYISGLPQETSFNARFILDMPKNAFSNKFLADSHQVLSLREKTKPVDGTVNTFKKFVSRGLIPA